MKWIKKFEAVDRFISHSDIPVQKLEDNYISVLDMGFEMDEYCRPYCNYHFSTKTYTMVYQSTKSFPIESKEIDGYIVDVGEELTSSLKKIRSEEIIFSVYKSIKDNFSISVSRYAKKITGLDYSKKIVSDIPERFHRELRHEPEDRLSVFIKILIVDPKI